MRNISAVAVFRGTFMRFFPRRNFLFKPFTRLIAACLTVSLLTSITLPGAALFAQPYTERWEKSEMTLTRYVDRATRFSEEAAWSSYVELGIATERVAWEREALDLLEKQIQTIESENADEAARSAGVEAALAEFEAARNVWDSSAENFLLTERGRFRAQKETVVVAGVEEDDYTQIVAAAEAAVAGDPDTDLIDWQAAISAPHAALVDAFEAELDAELDRARLNNAALDPVERDAFEDELSAIEEKIRREFETRDNFYVVRARNRYIALKRSDYFSARLESEAASAGAISEAVIEDTAAALASETESMLNAAVAGTTAALDGAAGPDLDRVGNDWERQIETIIDSGMRKWELAEEDLYKKRLAWMEESKETRAEAERIWSANHEKLKAARDAWLADLETQISEGRAQWQEKLAEFDRNRLAAEEDLAGYIAREREAWDASSGELGNMIAGGGAALLEAQDAYRYYDTLLGNMGQPADPDARQLYAFYVQQRDYMGAAITRFQTVLVGVEGVLPETLHSGAGFTGLLRDVREFAGDLPELIASLPETDFREELAAEMNSRGEDFLLYRRDLDDLAGRNAVFVARAGELAASNQFAYASAADLAGLRAMVSGIDRKYDEHRKELESILNRDRGALDEAARLVAIKTEIDAWFTESRDENPRLKRETVRYFQGGGAGYYLTREEGDPYLMTRAEYEWELLRRERNYLAEKLRSAEAVKQYADRAFAFEAGLEMAAVTAERADIARVHAELKEIAFKLIRGDFALNPAVRTDPAVAEAEFARVLAQYDIDPAALSRREDGLDDEIARYDLILAEASAPDAAEVAGLVADLDAYLATAVATEQRAEHPLGRLREKLNAYRNAVLAGASATEARDRWTVITGGAGLVREDLLALKNEFGFDALRADLTAVRGILVAPGLKELSGEMAAVKAEIQANATLLDGAARELDQARNVYRQARTDFEALRSGSAGDIIRQDLLNTSRELSSLLHRMVELENIPGLTPGTLNDAESAETLKFLAEVGARTQAEAGFAFAEDILVSLQSLEESKKRLAELEALLPGLNPALSPGELADVFLNKRAGLVTTGAANETLNSHGLVVTAMDRLASARAEYETTADELDGAIADGAAPASIEELRMVVSLLREEINTSVELVIAGMRGETEGRRLQVYAGLDQRDGNGNPLADPGALNTMLTARSTELTENAFDLGRAAATELKNFLTAHRETGYADLLGLANQAVASAADTRTVNTSISPYGSGGAVQPDAAAQGLKKWNMVRAYLVANRAALDYAALAPTAYDTRTVDEKWDDLLEEIDRLEADAGFYESFQDSLPASADDPRIVAFRTGRAALLSQIENLLLENDSNLSTAYRTLGSGVRDTLDRYSAVPGAAEQAFSGGELRRTLELIQHNLQLELSGLQSNFRQVFLREEAVRYGERLVAIEPTLTAKSGARSAAHSESAALRVEREDLTEDLAGESDPAARTLLESRMATIDARLTVLDALAQRLSAEIEPLETEYRQVTGILQEIAEPGATATLVPLARQGLEPYSESLNLIGWGVRGVEHPRSPVEQVDATSVGERLKAIIGFYETDRRGNILRDGAGSPIVAREFQDLGIADPAVDILRGGHSGGDLSRWATRLATFMAEHRTDGTVAPELRAAVELMEEAIRDYLAAEALIETRDLDGPTLLAQATERMNAARAKSEKLALLQELEGKLARAVEQANQSDQDPVAAALTVLDEPENFRLFFLFDGYDAAGNPDGVVDPEARARVEELRLLDARLRELRLTARLGAATAQYAEVQSGYIAYGDPDIDRPGPDDLRAAYPDLNGTNFSAAVTALAGNADFRANLILRLAEAPPTDVLFADEARKVLTASTAAGAELKDAVLAALAAMQDRIDATLDTELAFVDRSVHRDLSLKTTESVAALIAEYAAEHNVEAAELEQLTGELYLRDLNLALGTLAAADTYQADDYPAELRELVLVRGYQSTAARYADYQAARAAQSAALREAARLDLSGLPGDFARRVLAQDMDAFAAARPVAAFLNDPDLAELASGRFLSEYADAYLRDRQSDPALLPEAGALVFERTAHREYRRIQADALAGGTLAGLDERAYFADFREYLLLSKLEEYRSRTGLVLTGAGAVEQRENFRADFESMLDDPAFVVNGTSLRERLGTRDAFDRFFAQSFAHLYLGDGLDDYLPDFLIQVRDEGRLAQNPPEPDSFLPSELLAIADYGTRSVRDLAGGVSATTLLALGRLDALEAAAGDEGFGTEFSLSDDQAALILARAGYDTVSPAVRSELFGFLKNHNARALLGDVGSADEAVQVLRSQKVLRAYFPDRATERELELFLARQGATAGAIDAKLLGALANGYDALRTRIEGERGTALVALRERAEGRSTAYYDSLAPELQARMDELAATLFGPDGLSTAEKTALSDEAPHFARFLDFQSSQEIVASGLFGAAEAAVSSGFARGLNTADLEFARNNRSAALRAFIESLYVAEGRLSAPGAETTALLAARPGLSAALARTLADMDPALRAGLLDRQPAVERFLDVFDANDEERRTIAAVLNDSAPLDPLSALAPDYRVRTEAALRAAEASELSRALIDSVRAHGTFFANLGQSYEREFALADRLRSDAASRGSGPNFMDDRFAHYRSFIGMEEQYTRGEYDNYVAGLDAGETPLTFDVYHSAQLLKGEVVPGLAGRSPENILNAADWRDVLISDRTDRSATVNLGTDTPDPGDDRTVTYRTVYTVATGEDRRASGTDPATRLRYVHYENLANNYLEATSDLNRALNAVFTAAKMADARRAETSRTTLGADVRDRYDASAVAPVDLSAVQSLKQQAATDLATHSTDAGTEARANIRGVHNQRAESATAFAEAGRRGLLLTMELVDFLETVFNDARDAMQTAEGEYGRLSRLADENRARQATVDRAYVTGLNEMAGWMRAYSKANDEYELRQAVKEYAETPYLFATAGDAPDGGVAQGIVSEYRGDAKEEYELALAAVSDANLRLREAGYAVQVQDRLDEFQAIVAILEGADLDARTALVAPLSLAERERLITLRDAKFGDFRVLTAVEETELATLTRRELYERNRDLIERRSDYIAHSQRMVRLRKASEIINAEIERRRMVADMKKKKFESLLDRTFGGNFQEAVNEREWSARNAVYLRMVGVLEGGASVYDEYRGWFAGADGWTSPHYILSTKVNQAIFETVPFVIMGPSFWSQNFTPGDILKIVAALGRGETTPVYDSLPPVEQVALTDISEKLFGANGTLSEDERETLSRDGFDFNSVFVPGRDLMPNRPYETGGQRGENNHASMLSSRIPLADQAAIGTWMNAGGTLAEFAGFQGTYYSLLHAIGYRDQKSQELDITRSIFYPIMGVGFGLMAASYFSFFFNFVTYALGIAMVMASDHNIGIAERYYYDAEMRRAVLQNNAYSQSTAGDVRTVLAAQYEYEDALAALTYFTQVPDMQQLKDRMIQWGGQHDDTAANSTENLYDLTDEDLQYLFDTLGAEQFIDSSGAAQTLTTQEQNDAIDVTAAKEETEFGDIFGRRYDPYSLTTTQPGPLEGGVYRGADGDYVRLKKTQHDGTSNWVYARLRENPDAVAPDRAYDMGRVYDLLADHGQGLRDNRYAGYLAAGDAHADAGFILNERDDTLSGLFVEAAERDAGGREFTGYRVNFADYLENANRIQEQELEQRVAVQRKDWDLRAAEIRARYDAWEKKVATIMDRGKKSWAGSEDRFLQEWRAWERDFDRDVQAGEKVWDERVAEHFTKKADWEKGIREQAAERTIESVIGEAVDSLNAQLKSAERNFNSDFGIVDRTAAVNSAMVAMRATLPDAARLKTNINADIKRFNASLNVDQFLGRDLAGGLAAVSRDFKEALDQHREQMNILAKVKIFEQYRQMMDGFKQNIEVQNQQIENQTTQAALAQGFVRSGDIFTKNSGLSGHTVRVNAYRWFDVDTVLKNELAKSGFSEKSGADLTNFLEHASEVEVQSYFHLQKLALQNAFDAIMGRGNAADRKNSQDPGVIGHFSAWVGTGASETRNSAAELEGLISKEDFKQTDRKAEDLARFKETLARLQQGDLSPARREALLSMLATVNNPVSGFMAILPQNEDPIAAAFASTAGVRPGGAPLGFYPQLRQAEHELADKDEEWAEDQTINPIAGIFNSLNPIMMVANAVRDYRVGVEVYGKDPGSMLGAAFASVGKQLASAAGAAIMSVATFGVGTAIGAALVLASNMMQVNTKTGEVGMELNAEIAFNSVIDIGSSLVGMSGISDTGKAAVKLVGGAMKGAARGDSFGEIMLNAGISAAGSGLGKLGSNLGGGSGFGGWVGKEIGSKTASVFGEYLKKETGMRNNYAAVTTADIGTLGDWAGDALGDSLAKRNGWAREANKTDEQNRATSILQGAGTNLRREDFGDLGVLLGKAAESGARAIGWDSAANWLGGLGYRSDGEITSYLSNAAVRTGNQTAAIEILADAVEAGYMSQGDFDEALKRLDRNTLAAAKSNAKWNSNTIRTNSVSSVGVDILKAQGINVSFEEFNAESWKYSKNGKTSTADMMEIVASFGGDITELDPNQLYQVGQAHSQAMWKIAALERQMQQEQQPQPIAGGSRYIIRDDLIGRDGLLGLLDSKTNSYFNLVNTAQALYQSDTDLGKFARKNDMTHAEAVRKVLEIQAAIDAAGDKVKDWAGKVKWDRVAGGVLRTVGGAGEAAIGAAFGLVTSPTVVGAVAGGAIFVHGAFQASTGVEEIWNALNLDDRVPDTGSQKIYRLFSDGKEPPPEILRTFDDAFSLGTGVGGFITIANQVKNLGGQAINWLKNSVQTGRNSVIQLQGIPASSVAGASIVDEAALGLRSDFSVLREQAQSLKAIGLDALARRQVLMEETFPNIPWRRSGSLPSPNTAVQEMVQGPYSHPMTNQFTIQAPGEILHADHIVSYDSITKMINWHLLERAQRLKVLNYSGNFQGLPGTFNMSKGAKTASEWLTWKGQPLNPDYVQGAIQIEARASERVTRYMDALLRRSGRRW